LSVEDAQVFSFYDLDASVQHSIQQSHDLLGRGSVLGFNSD
jgi:hypothetical protein